MPFFTGQGIIIIIKMTLYITFDAIYIRVLVEETLHWETRLGPGYSLALEELTTSVAST